MTQTSENSKRIAKNTLMLYFRTFVTIIVALYTSRIVLETLGDIDFGIYNIVGGVVILFSFIQGAMTAATQRFLNFEMGCGTPASVNRIFSMSLTAHIIISLFVLFLGETIGLWFINNKLNIPADREIALNWVYQFSLLTTCVSIIRVPYHATIVAHENMDFYAYISIVESVLRLLIVYMLVVFAADKLIMYAILTFAVSLITTICYALYSRYHFKSSRYKFFWDGALFNKLISFSGWSLLGGAANAGSSQGVNIIINIFFGVTVNAAVGVATQVQAAVASFMSNFQTAFNPQLVKSYAQGDHNYFVSLINQTAKLSFFLIAMPAIPLIVCAEPILTLWLVDVPDYAVRFTQFTVLFILLESLSTPLWTSVQAIGKIKEYQIMMSIIIAMNIPITYLLFWLGCEPTVAIGVRVCISLISCFARLLYLSKMIVFPLGAFIKRVLLRSLSLAALLIIVAYYINMHTNLFVAVPLIVLANAVLIYILGLTKGERRFVLKFAQKKG
ncbi:MAG: lipopolysaccharide biosynthesis protein [Rikenellaceae bacterium]